MPPSSTRSASMCDLSATSWLTTACCRSVSSADTATMDGATLRKGGRGVCSCDVGGVWHCEPTSHLREDSSVVVVSSFSRARPRAAAMSAIWKGQNKGHRDLFQVMRTGDRAERSALLNLAQLSVQGRGRGLQCDPAGDGG